MNAAARTPTTEPSPGRPRRAETDHAINAATRSLLVEVGYDKLTIEAVAKLANVGKPTVYRRHSSKASLVASALMETLEAANPRLPESGDVRADLQLLLSNLVNALETTDFGRAVAEIVSPASRETHLAELFDAALAERRVLLQNLIGRAAKQDLLMSTDPEVAIDMALGAIYFRHLFTHEPLDTAFVTSLVSSLVHPTDAGSHTSKRADA